MPGRNQPRSSRGRSAIARKVINTNSTNGIMYQGTCVAHDGTKITPCHNFGGMKKGGSHPSATGFMRSQPYKITATAKNKNYLFNMRYFRKPSIESEKISQNKETNNEYTHIDKTIYSIDCSLGSCNGINEVSGCIMSTTDGSFCCTDGSDNDGTGCNDATKLCSIGDTEIELCKRKIKTCSGKGETTFSLAPNGIFMDTYGRWAFNIQDPNAFPALTYNGRAIVNFMYMAKTLSENASKIGTTIPISFFQLSGGNIPIGNSSNTYPTKARSKNTNIPEKLYKYTGHVDPYKSFDESSTPTSQFATYFFGSNLDSSLNNMDKYIKQLSDRSGTWYTNKDTTLLDYFTTNNHDTQISAKDFGLSNEAIKLFDWASDKTQLFKKCHIKSISWGSDQAYSIAPFQILKPLTVGPYTKCPPPPSTCPPSYGTSWILYDQVMNYKNNNNHDNPVDMGGVAPKDLLNNVALTDISFEKYILYDTLATYSSSEVTFQEAQSDWPGKWAKLGIQDIKIEQFIQFLNKIRDNGGNPNIKPYIAQYVIVGSYGIDALFYSIQYIKLSIINMISNCFLIEEYGYNAGFSPSETWGDMCLSPDFGLFAQHLSQSGDTQTNQEWSDLLGDWTDSNIISRHSQLQIYQNDVSLKKSALDICQAFIDYNDVTKYFPCAKYYCSSYCGKCSTCIYTKSKEDCSPQLPPEGKGEWDCSSCQPRPKNMVNRSHYMKNLQNWIKLNWNDFSKFIDIKKVGGLQSINCLIGFFLNTCGSHVNAGWDIGWVFNNTGSGTWAHNSYSANDFKYTGDTVLNYQGYINRTKKGNITDPTLFYLKNAVYGNLKYGSNEKVNVDSLPPIYDASKTY